MADNNKNYIRRNSIIWVDMGAKKGCVQSGFRPCIVVSCDKANRHSRTYNVIPGTTKCNKMNFPVHCLITPDDIKGYLKTKTVFLVEQLCTINESQILSIAGYIVNEDKIEEINKMILKQLDIENQ